MKFLCSFLPLFFVATFALADELSRGVSDDTLNANEQNSLSANPQTTLAAKDNAFKLFFAEFGVGYTRMNFKATQTPLGKIYIKEGVTTDIYERQNYPKKGVGNGADIFLTLNLRLTQKFGLNFGVGAEAVAVKWDDALLDYNWHRSSPDNIVAAYPQFSIDSISKDTLISLYITLGAFYDIWQGKERAVRVFGNMGWAITDKFQKSSFETDFYGIVTVYDEGSIKHDFYTLGLRYNFARHHGIELASKLKGRLNFDNKSAVKTDITWGHTLNLRYVYEF